jgi:6-phosphogluconolactonase (cycloisomerase 2 family)
MKLSLVGQWSMALLASLALGLGMTACGGGTIGYMWVLGQEYNQIAGFKVDQFSGNLTQVPDSPFVSNGAVPVSIVVKSDGGNFVYVVNQGTCPTAGCGTGPNVGQNVALYSVGGDGVLTFQESYATQGFDSQWAQFNSSGSFLYVVDKYSPSLGTGGLYNGPNKDGNGAITAFSADTTTGRLTLLTNSQTQVNGVNTPFWEVGPSPIMSKSQAGCLYTLNTGTDVNGLQTVTPFSVAANGQLIFTTTGNIEIPQATPGTATNLTSITGSQSFMFLTDASATPVLWGYQSTGACGLSPLNGGHTNLATFFPTASDPVYSMIDSTGKFLYVLNNSTTSTQTTTPFSSISAFVINPTNQELQPIDSPVTFPVGSGPVCMVEDPSNQYVYTSNSTAGTVTGYQLNAGTGELSDLTKGSTFTTVGKASCMAISGSVL